MMECSQVNITAYFNHLNKHKNIDVFEESVQIAVMIDLGLMNDCFYIQSVTGSVTNKGWLDAQFQNCFKSSIMFVKMYI